ncbi:MAG: hypothetical protein Q9209_005206 [Squamulea sp. 1 TL-2023]
MAERRSSRRSSASSSSQILQDEFLRSSNPDVFSDEYALESLDPSNGFQPQRPRDILVNSRHREEQDCIHTDEPSRHDIDHTLSKLGRDSGSRKRGTNERLLSHQDGSRQLPSRNGRAVTLSDETSNSALYRSASGASITSMLRTQSPYQGSTPSQPYAMYPQNIGFSRTPSMATTSTVRPRERSYVGSSRPAQPYGMYPQNTVPEDNIGSMQSLHPPIPAGFPGRSYEYRRRLGPDAEDVDDLIGPDGYTEQLPPYTRYPDDIPPKEGVPGPASNLSVEHGEPGRSEEVLMNPFQSRESLQQPPESILQDIEQHHRSTDATAAASSEPLQQDEGGNFKERVKEQSRKRICCGRVPLWVVAVLVLLMIAVLAGTIGGVVGNARGEQHPPPTPTPKHRRPASPAAQSTIIATITTTSLVDATPLVSTPTNLPTLPTGSFFVPLRNLSISHNSCLQSFSMAWECADEQDLKLDLSVPGSISVSPRFPTQNNQVRFGPQLPQLDQPIALKLMGDREGMDKGPAWWFQQPYTKVVVVRAADFKAYGGAKDKRWLETRHARKERRQTVARVTSKPWFCYWNNTILEGFIYVTQNFSGQYQPVSSDYAASSRPLADLEAPASSYESDSFAAYSPFPSGSAESLRKRTMVDPTQLAAYSKDIKIEERRAPDTDPAPYCVHMQIMNDGTASAINDESGSPVTIQLLETASTYNSGADQPDKQKERRASFWERDPSTGKCECEWSSN